MPTLIASHGTDDTRGRSSESCRSNLLHTTLGIIISFSSCFAVGIAICLILDLALRRRFIGFPRFRLADRGTKTLGAVIFVSVGGDNGWERSGSRTSRVWSGRRRRHHDVVIVVVVVVVIVIRSFERCQHSMLRTVLLHLIFPSCGRR